MDTMEAVTPTSARSSISLITGDEEKMQQTSQLPPKKGIAIIRSLQHRIFDLYRRFFSIVLVANIIAVVRMFQLNLSGKGLSNMLTACSANLVIAVLMRQEYVINALFAICCSCPSSAPLWLRRNLAKVYHIGGLHSGCAVASTIWLVIFTISATLSDHANLSLVVVSLLLVVFLISMVATAMPMFRKRYHDKFEVIHRFAGWTAVVLFWVQTIVATESLKGDSSLPKAMAMNPGPWCLLIATISIIIPWLHLKKISIRCEQLSGHATRVWLSHNTTTVGTTVRLSDRPLLEWHSFATVVKPDEHDYSLIVSNAGDWTSKVIRTAPTKMWVRGIPTEGVLRIVPLFRNIVLMATGSGIGPCLPIIYAATGKQNLRIYWSTRTPVKTYGQDIVNDVLATDSNAIIHDTTSMGRSDMVEAAYRLVKESGAEAVCCISNQTLTQQVVYAMEARGIPAYGAIFDS